MAISSEIVAHVMFVRGGKLSVKVDIIKSMR